MVEWELKELQLQSNISNLKLEIEFSKKGKESVETSVDEQKRNNKDLKDKIKSLEQDKLSLEEMNLECNKQKENMISEINKLREEINEKQKMWQD